MSTEANADATTTATTEAEATSALQVLVLTQHIHQYLKQHDPKALEQAIAALRDTLPEDGRGLFEERLGQATSEASQTKVWEARIKVFLPMPHWSFESIDDGKTTEVLFEGPGTPYLSRS